MAETKKEATGQESTAKAADAKEDLAVRDTSTQSAVDLFTSILSEVQRQVQGKTPKELEGKALEALDLFRDIVAALSLAPKPTITLIADDSSVQRPGDEVTINWTSTGANRITLTAQETGSSVVQDLGVLKPTAGGSKRVQIFNETTFRATADPCGSNFAEDVASFPVIP